MKTWIPGLMMTALLAACGGDHEAGHDDGCGAHAHDDDHTSSHGGELIEFGQHEGHIEILHEDDAGAVRIWVSDGDLKPLDLDGPPVMSFTAAGAPVQVTGTGGGAEWTFTHEALKGEPGKSRFKIVAKGKPFTPSWDHHH